MPLLAFSLSATADQVILDDLIISQSLCVGLDCIDGEIFEFDTIRLKDDNPQINFVDTSSSASFPSNDWSMGANDNANAGTPTFFIKDTTGDHLVLQIAPGTNGGIALGADSTLQDDSVSVGSPGAERRIVNVAAGVEDTDAVNMAQFEEYKTELESSIDTQFAELTVRINALITQIDQL